MRILSRLHVLISILIVVLLPVIVYMANGEVGAEVVVLGAVLGFANWYWWSPTI